MPRSILFPTVDAKWNPTRGCVLFYVLDDRVLLNCLVTEEALVSHFGVRTPSGEECLRAFNENRQQIQDAARKKLLSRPASRPGDEVLLVDSDFTSQSRLDATTNFQHPRHSLLNISIDVDPGQVVDARLTSGIDLANSMIASELSLGEMSIGVNWVLIPASENLTLARLTLTDEASGASAQGLYTRDDFENRSALRFSLFRMWDDVLREKGRRQWQVITAAEKAGTP